MPYIDSQIFKKKGEKKNLTITLSEGEPILASIKTAMAQNKIGEVKVEDMSGEVKEATISFMSGSKYECKELRNQGILRASGNFKLNFDELYGNMHISTAGKSPITGTFVKGKAAEGLEIKMSFVEIKDK